MSMEYATVTGRIVVPGTTTGIPGELRATPMTSNGVLAFPAEDYTTIGAAPADVLADGTIEQDGTPGLKIPTDVPTGMVWQLKFHPKGKGNLPVHLGYYEIPASADLSELVAVDLGAITEETKAQIAAAVALGATNDTATASFVADGDSATRAALSATYAAKGGVRYASDFAGSNVSGQLNTAIASFAGATGVLVIPADMGSGEPTAPYPPNVTIIDYRAGVPGAGVRFGASTVPAGGAVRTMLSITEQDDSPNGVSLETLQTQAFLTGTASGVVTVEAATAAAYSKGAFGVQDPRVALVGVEGVAKVGSTGGSVERIRGGSFNVGTMAGDTTLAGEGAAVVAQAPLLVAAGKITNCYGLIAENQVGGNARNFAIWSQGNVLMNNLAALYGLLPKVTATDGAMTAGSNVLTSASASFTTTLEAGSHITVPGAGPSGGSLRTIVTAVTGATTATVLTPAQTTVAGATYSADGKRAPIINFGTSAADNTVIYRYLDDAAGIAFKTQSGITKLTLGSSITFGANIIMGDTSGVRNVDTGTVNGTRFGLNSSAKVAFYGATPVTRPAGWAKATGTSTRTAFDTTTVTTAQLAERVKALIEDLFSDKLGLIGA